MAVLERGRDKKNTGRLEPSLMIAAAIQIVLWPWEDSTQLQLDQGLHSIALTGPIWKYLWQGTHTWIRLSVQGQPCDYLHLGRLWHPEAVQEKMIATS